MNLHDNRKPRRRSGAGCGEALELKTRVVLVESGSRLIAYILALSRQSARFRAGCDVGQFADSTNTVLEELVAKGDPIAFDEFKHRVSNHGLAPQHEQGSFSGGGAPYRPSGMAPGAAARAAMGAPMSRRECPASASPSELRTDKATVTFKPSPFYNVVGDVLRPTDLPGR